MRDEANKNRIDTKLLELLVCPLTKGPLTFDAERGELVSRAAKTCLSGSRRHPRHVAFGGAPDRGCRNQVRREVSDADRAAAISIQSESS